MVRIFKVSAECENDRIDKYLSEHMYGTSRSYIQKLAKTDNITVFDKKCKSNYKVSEGDIIFLNIPKPITPDILPEDIPLDIVYEDSDIVIVNKPKHMVVHPAAGHYTGTLVNGLMYHCRDNLSGINGVMRPGIVHRIDMDTTGILIICKNDNAHVFISDQLKKHSVKRKYQAIVHGIIKDDEGTINAPIGRDPNNRMKMAILEKGGKEAITHFKVLERFKDFTYIECQLETGRTHQIRVHMASINHPLLGDFVYGPSKCPYKLMGQTLHAKTLGFIHPTSHEYMRFDSPLPDYFKHLLEILPKQ